MMHRIVSSLLALGVLGNLGLTQDKAPAAAPTPSRNIILVGWDGAQREHVQECLDKGQLPVLKQLISEGAWQPVDVRGTTDTKAGWSEILTGYGPPVTGVYSNGRYQPVPEGFSVFERLKSHFGPDKFVAAAAIGKKGHCGEIDPPQKVEISEERAKALQGEAARKRADAEDDQTQQPKAKRKGLMGPGSKIVEEEGKKYLVTPGKPYMNMHKACDQWVFGLMQNEKVGNKAIEFLDQYKDKPFFFFVHFAEVDHSGHKKGENSKEYADALISCDTWTGKIIAKLKELGLYERTLIYVTADHGFDEDRTSHRYAPTVFMATNDKGANRPGLRSDITPTVYDRFGLDLAAFQPPLDGRSLLKADDRPPAPAAAEAGKKAGKRRKKANP